MRSNPKASSLAFAFLAIAALAASQICSAQMPEQLSTDPGNARTILEQTFRPFLFEKIDDETLWSLKWRTYYFDRRNDNAADNLAFATGGWVGFRSKPLFESLRVGGSLFTSQKLYGPDDKDGSGLLAPGQESFSGNLEAFLDWSGERLNATAGRMRLETPFMHSSDIRMIPISFQGARALYHITPKWGVGGMYITHMKPLDSDDFERVYNLAGVADDDRGVWSIGTRYQYSEDGEIGVFAYHAEDLIDIVYYEFSHDWDLGQRNSLGIGFQHSHQQSHGSELNGSFEIDHVGMRFHYQRGATKLAAAYTRMSDTQGLFTPWGYSPTFNGGIVKEFTRAGETAWSIGASIDFNGVGSFAEDTLLLHTYYISGDSPDSGPTASPSQSEFDVTLEYNFDIGPMKGFHLRIRNASINQTDSDGNNDAQDLNDFRIILNYDYRW